MTWVRAIYKIPELRHIFLVVALPEDRPNLSKESEKQKKHLEHILRSKYLGKEKKYPEWKLKLIQEDDFLEIIEEQAGTMRGLTNPSIENSEHMELLAINLQTPKSRPDPLSLLTPKVLGRVSNDDIIEVFV